LRKIIKFRTYGWPTKPVRQIVVSTEPDGPAN